MLWKCFFPIRNFFSIMTSIHLYTFLRWWKGTSLQCGHLIGALALKLETWIVKSCCLSAYLNVLFGTRTRDFNSTFRPSVKALLKRRQGDRMFHAKNRPKCGPTRSLSKSILTLSKIKTTFSVKKLNKI
jgi:hypothetical protein